MTNNEKPDACREALLAECRDLLREAQSKTCMIAAELVRLDGILGDDASDYKIKVPKAILKAIGNSHESQRLRGIRLKVSVYERIASAINKLDAATALASSPSPVKDSGND